MLLTLVLWAFSGPAISAPAPSDPPPATPAQAPPSDTSGGDIPDSDAPGAVVFLGEDQPDPGPIMSQRAIPLGGSRPDRLIPKGAAVASPDSAHVAFRHRWGREYQYFGYSQDDHSSIGVKYVTDPVFTPDSQSTAVLMYSNKWWLYYKWRTLPGFEAASAVRFSPNGERLVYLARMEDQQFVVEGEQPQPMADTVLFDKLVFTGDSSTLAYPAFDGQQWRVVVNGEPGPKWDRLATGLTPASQGPAVLFLAVKDGRWHLVDRHQPGPGFRSIQAAPVLSDDGRTFAYWAMGDDRTWRVYQNHQYVPGYDAQRAGQLILSHDGQTLAAILKRDGQWFVVHNGQPGPVYAAIGKDSLTLSPDGASLVYAAKKQHGWALVLDGQEQQTFSQLLSGGLRFSPDSQHLAYGALYGGRWSLIVDGQPQQPFERIDARTLTFSPDSQRTAYLAYRYGQPVVVLDGEVIGEYDRVRHLTFSPDSRHLAYAAQQHGQWFLAVDGVNSDQMFDEFIPGAKVQFTTDTAFHTAALRRPGPHYYRIELNLAPAPETNPAPDPDGTPDPEITPAQPLSPFVDVPTE